MVNLSSIFLLFGLVSFVSGLMELPKKLLGRYYPFSAASSSSSPVTAEGLLVVAGVILVIAAIVALFKEK